MKPDYVICVGGTPCHGWLTLPSDEQCDTDVIVTIDPKMVARYANYDDAKPTFDALVAAHPHRQFRMMTLTPMGTEGETFEPPNAKLTGGGAND